MSLGSVDISFRHPVGNSVEVRSEALLCPGYPCHLLFSEMGKKFEEKDKNKGKKKNVLWIPSSFQNLKGVRP